MIRLLIQEDITPLSKNRWKVTGDSFHHLVRVLRFEPHETLELLDGKGGFSTATQYDREKNSLTLEMTLDWKTDPTRTSKNLSVAAGLLKGDAWEWSIQKSVELGVRDFYPLKAEYSVVKIAPEKMGDWIQRARKIADLSLEQSGRLDRMTIHPPETPAEWVSRVDASHVLWADEKSDSAASESFSKTISQNFSFALIGPEGGWSEKERTIFSKHGLKPHKIHPWILRAETAIVLLASTLQTK